ncbi:hypothetical protein Cgig2_019658 [Carnegiea gigantea]|uniref:STAS domain-containing protein n=1 Tax=Carnegiea gigantea TaxID=171969 RepID=A0A9Q1KIZ2_9CARY|nr:hypothetical protein Cgig2_019658 [Carnegiea gigantea]
MANKSSVVDAECTAKVPIPAEKPFLKTFKSNLKETFFPDDPFRMFKAQSLKQRIILGLQYLIPILQWLPNYNLDFFKSDIVAGITIASLAVPQGISYANLASLPPLVGLYTNFVPALVYAVMGSSKDLAIGNVAVASILFSDMLGKVVSPIDSPREYLSLVFTATFFAGIIEASLGFLRLGFLIDLLSHATIVGFMGGVAVTVCLQQLKGLLGLTHFTHKTDVVSVLHSTFAQTHESNRKPAVFWINAMAPLTSVILGTLLVYFTHAENHGVRVIGHLNKGLNPLSLTDLAFGSPHLSTAFKTGAITAIVVMAEGVAVGRSFAMCKNYHVDGNKEMIAFGLMNIVGSCTSCYLTTGIFSRTAVNFNAGCKTAMSNIVMAIAVMVTLLCLTPLFHYTPLVVLSSIIINAMLGLIKYEEVFHLWKVDKFDFVISMSSFFGVVFANVETGLTIGVTLSLLRLVLIVARPKTFVLGNLPNTMVYRSTEQYQCAQTVAGILILQIEGPICFASSNYLRERVTRWIHEEEDRIKSSGGLSLQYVILDVGGVGCVDTSGISVLEEVKKLIERKSMKLVLANPGNELMKKMYLSKCIEEFGQEGIYPTVAEAVNACTLMLQMNLNPGEVNGDRHNNV